MADGTTLPGTGVVVQDDEVTTVNGGAVAASKVQRIKVDSAGLDGAHRDTSRDFPFPIFKPNRAATGSLTALNSAVSLILDGDGDVSIDVEVTSLVGTITFQQRLPGGTWRNTNATVAGTSSPTPTFINPSSGLYRLSSGGAAEIRVIATSYTSGSAAVIIGSSSSSNAIYANQVLPTKTNENAVVSTANSTTTNLAGAGVFTGTSEEASEYSAVMISVFASHASATDGLSIQQSSDGTNWDLVDAYSIPAATGKTFNVPVQAKFYRLVYTNGATLTTSLRIQTIFSKHTKRSSSVRPQDARVNDNDFEEMLAYNALMNIAGTWDRARGSIWGGMLAQLSGYNPTYRLFVPSGAAGANKVYWDLFNATGSGRSLRVLSVVPVVSGAVAVTGVVAVDLFLTRTSAVGTTGTAATADGTSLTAATITRIDPSVATLPAQITARSAPGGGATAGAVLAFGSFFTEETSVAAYQPQDLVRRYAGPAAPNIIVPENTGLRVVQGTVASVGNIGFDVIFEAVSP